MHDIKMEGNVRERVSKLVFISLGTQKRKLDVKQPGEMRKKGYKE